MQYCKAIILQLRILKIKRTIFSILFASQTKTCLTLPFSAGYCKVLFFSGANSPALYYLFSIATCSSSQMNQTSLCRKCHMVLHLSPRETSENPVKARDYLREPGNILLQFSHLISSGLLLHFLVDQSHIATVAGGHDSEMNISLMVNDWSEVQGLFNL